MAEPENKPKNKEKNNDRENKRDSQFNGTPLSAFHVAKIIPR